ncbi:MAG: hypothetical protein EG822_08340 [Deltaproteobacteria bacterium]|nr:hypothetical protein [Deltaproteobacteria bacterium]TLN02210.1 MAG: hypothetical protein FDZ73_12620 [bacterium]
MNRLLTLSAAILLTGLLAAPLFSAQTDPAAAANGVGQPQNEHGLVQPAQEQVVTDQSNPNDPALSLDERYKQRIEAKKRAAAMREQLLRESQEQTPEQAPQ